MRTSIIALTVTSLLLAGCGDGSLGTSRYNPKNWFGGSRAQAPSNEAANPLIPARSALSGSDKKDIYRGETVDKITVLRLEPTLDGVLVRVEGVAQTQRAYNVRLIDEGIEDGRLVLTLKAAHPDRAAYGPERSRKIVAAKALTDQELAGIKSVEVKGLRNSLIARR